MPSDIFVFFADGRICYSYCKDAKKKLLKSVFEFGAEFESSYTSNLGKIDKGEQLSIEYTYEGQRQKSLVARIPQGFFGETTYIATSVDITDLENAKRNFQELALRMRTTLASIGDAVITTDRDGNISFTNRVAEKLLGVGDEVIGLNLDEVYKVFDYSDNSPIPPPSKRLSVTSEESIHSNNGYFISKGGEMCHVSDTVSPIMMDGDMLGSILVFKDVTKARENERIIVDTNKMLNTLIENFPCAVFVKNFSGGGTYILHNKYFSEQAGSPGEDLVGKTPREIFPEEDAITFEMEEAIIAKSGDTLDGIKTSVQKDGSFSMSRVVKKSVVMENGDIYIMGVALDMTEFIRNREDLELHASQQRVINECLNFAIKSEKFDDTIAKVLELLGRTVKSDRAFIFTYNENTGEIVNKGSWIAEAYSEKPLKVDKLSNETGKVLMDRMAKGEVISFSKEIYNDNCSDLNKMRVVDGIKSGMVAGFFEGGRFAGFIGVDHIREEREYSKSDKNLLKSLLQIVELDLERYRQIEKNKKAENERRLILDSIHVPIMLFDANANLISLNNAAVKSLPKSKEQLLCEPCANNFCENKYTDPRLCPVKRAIAERRMVQTEMNIFGRHVISTGTPIFNEDGELINVIESDTDITEIVETNQKLKDAMEAAQESERAKSFFLATMSHELRTPLNAVIGYSELTQDPKLSQGERIHNLKNINFAANTLLTLINDILDLSKLEAGQLEMHKTPVNLHSTMEEFAGVFKFATSKKGVYLKMHLQDDIPVVMMDMLRLKQIIMNIMGNAVKFTSKGGIDISVSFEKKSQSCGDLHISIKDSGIGIAKKNIDSIFNPFAQDHTQRIRGRGGYEGTGLGLPIVRRLMDRMGGNISVESVEGEGSTFKLYFGNVDIASKEDLEKIKPDNAETKTHHHKVKNTGASILIVDDILLNVKVLKNMLKNMGIEVIDTLDPEKVADILKISKPDLVMTDLWMPKMNGEELAKEIRANPETSDIPIIAVTADTQVQDPDKVFNDILFKPITIQAISSILEKWLPSSEESDESDEG